MKLIRETKATPMWEKQQQRLGQWALNINVRRTITPTRKKKTTPMWEEL